MFDPAKLMVPLCLIVAGCASNVPQPANRTHDPANPSAAEAPPAPSVATALGPTQDLPAPQLPRLAEREPATADHAHEHATPAPAAPAHEHGAQRAPAAQAKPRSPSPPMYTCPMHPEVKSSKKTDRCPKCGMKLEPIVVPDAGPGRK